MSVLEAVAINETPPAFSVGERVRVQDIPARVLAIDERGLLRVRLTGSVNALWLAPVHVRKDDD